MAITISVVDDDDGIRESLVFLLNQEEGFRCINQYRTAEAALAGVRRTNPTFCSWTSIFRR